MTDQDLIVEGRRLLAAATPAPWELDPHSHIEKGCRCTSCFGPTTVSWTSNMLSCNDVPTDGLDQQRCDQVGFSSADSALVVHMRNTYGPLLDGLERTHQGWEQANARAAAADEALAELERWKANAETTLAEDKRYLDEARADLQELHNDTQQHYAAIAARQQRYARDHDLYRGALRDAARMLADLGVTNPPPRFTEALALEEIPR